MQTIIDDADREKSIIIDANSNEKRLKEEKQELIEIDSKYYETEKSSSEDLSSTKNKLQIEIENIKDLIKSNKNEEAIKMLDSCKLIIDEYADIYSKNQNIKKESIKEAQELKLLKQKF